MRRRLSFVLTLALVGTSALAFDTIDFNGEPARWPDARCTMYHDPAWSGYPSFISELRAAMSPWTNVSGSNFVFRAGGASPSAALDHRSNGNSDVFFGDLSPNVYAITWVMQQGPTLFDRDVVFNTDWTWSTGSGAGVDFRSVAVHELGHVLGLGHETTKPAVMQPYYDGSTPMHTLEFDDEEGCRFIYPEPEPPPAEPSDTDLVIGNVTFEPEDASSGDEVRVSFGMRNAGTDPTGTFAATVYLTEATSVSPDDRYLGARIQASLEPGETRDATVRVRLPDALEPRIFRIGVILDAQRATGDRDPENNAAVATKVVQGGGDALEIGPGYLVTGTMIPFGRESFAMELTAGTRLHVRSTLEGGSLELTIVEEATGTVLVSRRRFRRASGKLHVAEDGRYLVHIDSHNATASDYEVRVGAKTIRIAGTLTIARASQLHLPGYLGTHVDAKVKAKGDVRPTLEWANLDIEPAPNRRGNQVKLRRTMVPTTGPLVLVMSQGEGPAGDVRYRVRMRIPKKGPELHR
jgi:hypothetical protein